MAKKIYYKISEVCKQVGIEPFVLRYWETEFPFLVPSKNKSGHRTYKQRDIEIIRRIHQLLREEGYTVPGARKKLEAELEAGGPGVEPSEASTKKGADSSSPKVDTAGAERLKKLRSGLEGALAQAQEILTLFEPPSAASKP